MNENEAQTKMRNHSHLFFAKNMATIKGEKPATKQRISFVVATVQKIDSKTDCQQAVNRHIEFGLLLKKLNTKPNMILKR